MKLTTSNDLPKVLHQIITESGGKVNFVPTNRNHLLFIDSERLYSLRRSRTLSFCDGWRARNECLQATPVYCQMTIQTGCAYVMMQLTDKIIMEAGDKKHGENRGWKEVLRLTDAAAILPFAEHDYTEPLGIFIEYVIAEVTTTIINMWETRTYCEEQMLRTP